jgi:DNA-binding CsgD family transcriptional regulator
MISRAVVTTPPSSAGPSGASAESVPDPGPTLLNRSGEPWATTGHVLHDVFGRPDDAGDLRALDDPDHPQVVAFSWSVEPAVVSRAIDEGAAGYVAKSLPAEDLVVALERVHAGERVLALGREDDCRADIPPGSEAGLSGREHQVLTLITEGFTNQEIARQCFLSVNSVKTYVRTAYRKIGVTRRAQAVAWGIEHRLDQHDACNDVAAE